MNNSIITQVIEQLTHLPGNLQRQVLEYAQSLKASLQRGVPGRQLLRFAGVIPLDDLQLMHAAIDAAFERVDLNEW